jgi:long-chain acyl-CoA synthetase
LPEYIKEEFNRITKDCSLIEGYGITEALTIQCCNLPYLYKKNSIGIPLPNVEFKIVNLNDPDIDLSVGKIGEIAIKSLTTSKKYWSLDDQFRNFNREWLLTGDVGRVDEDGFYYFYNKKSEIINVNDKLIIPREIELVINNHPKVLENCVFVKNINENFYLISGVVLKEGKSIKPCELINYCSQHLEIELTPDFIKVYDELPRDDTGRINRKLIEDNYTL